MSSNQGVTRKERREQMRSQRQARAVAARQRERRRRLLMGIGGVVVVAVVVVITLILANQGDETADSADLPDVVAYSNAYPETIPQQTRLLGNPDAPLRMIEYGDYQCPYCADVAKLEVPFIIERYVATGLISFEYHNFAFLDQGSDALESHIAAEAAECAGDQGRYWDYHKTLYYNQYGENQGGFSPERLKLMAEGLELSDDFATCLDSGKYEDFVNEQTDQARAAGITGTPSFVIAGTQVQVLGQSQEQIAAAIDDILRQNGIEPPAPYDPANYPTPTPPVALPINDSAARLPGYRPSNSSTAALNRA
jgi:protein-disulfide isomerase